jgi:dUTP pyrophosphatase
VLLEFTKTHSEAKVPSRGHPSDAGLDVYYCPKNPREIAEIVPGRSILLGTGLRFGVPHGYMLEVKNRSSVASKRSLLVGACVIDSGYDGEVFINLHNVGQKTQVIKIGEKIAQLVMVPVVPFRVIHNAKGSLYDRYPIAISDRKDGALGSTNAKKRGYLARRLGNEDEDMEERPDEEPDDVVYESPSHPKDEIPLWWLDVRFPGDNG